MRRGATQRACGELPPKRRLRMDVAAPHVPAGADVPAAAQAQCLERDDAAGEASAAPSQAGAFVGVPGGHKVEAVRGRGAQGHDGQPGGPEHPRGAARRCRLETHAVSQQGVLLAVLDHAGGGGSLDPQCGLRIITTEHVQRARRLLDVGIAIRAELLQTKTASAARRRAHVPSPASSRAMPSRRFRRASRHAGSSLRVGAACVTRSSSPGAHGRATGCGRRRIWPRHRPACLCGRRGGLTSACHPLERRPPEVLTLQFADVPGEANFDKAGLGEAGAMIFTNPLS